MGATATSAQGGPKASPRRGAKDNYEMMYIRKEDLKLKEELGQGEFGSVLRGTYKGPSGKVCVYMYVRTCTSYRAYDNH